MLKAKPVAKLGDIGDTRDPAAHILEGDNIAHVKETTLTRQHNAVERREFFDDIFQRHGNGPRFATQRESGPDIDSSVGRFVSLKDCGVPLEGCAEI